MNTTPRKKQKTIHLPDPLNKRLINLAKIYGLDESEMSRQLILHGLQSMERDFMQARGLSLDEAIERQRGELPPE